MSPEAPRRSSGEALDPATIVSRQFATARRGLDSAEVRAYLHELSRTIDDLQRREAELTSRAEHAESRAVEAERLDEHRLVELLGEETTRVLAASRGAATDIKNKAQESAARLISQANDEAHQVRADAERAVASQRAEMIAEVEALRREAAGELERRRSEADEIVAQMVSEAEAECEALRRAGDQDRRDASDEAKAIRAQGEEEGHQMVAEAQLVRERMLRDLARRRRAAREQLERLHAARDRLLAAYEVVRRTVAEATAELQVALPEAKIAGDQAMRRVHGEPEPTVDELEAQVSMARIAGLLDPLQPIDRPVSQADEWVDDSEPGLADEPADDAGAGLAREAGDDAGAGLPGRPGDRLAPGFPGERVDDSAPVLGGEPVDAQGRSGDQPRDVVQPEPADELAVPPEVDPGDLPPADSQPVVTGDDELTVEPGEPRETEDIEDSDDAEGPDDRGEDASDDATQPAPDLDELFARLREGQGHDAGGADDAVAVDDSEAMLVGAVAEARPVNGDRADGLAKVHAPPRAERSPQADRGAVDDEADARGGDGHDQIATGGRDADLLRQRDEALGTIEHDLARLLKRALADEQNEVLDLLRRTTPTSVDDLLPAVADHAERYADAARDELEAAANCGAIHVADAQEPQSEGFCDGVAAELGQAIVEPLRERIARSFAETGGDLGEVTGRLRALYREWKGQRIADAVRHYSVVAYAQGAYAALPDDAPLLWLVDRQGDPCPDADDNALAGLVCKGEAFPTGDQCPPAHLGCRCLVVTADA
ncbi:MAG: DivIVA domain-containing protein [Acidimicrobiales bacterium]